MLYGEDLSDTSENGLSGRGYYLAEKGLTNTVKNIADEYTKIEKSIGNTVDKYVTELKDDNYDIRLASKVNTEIIDEVKRIVTDSSYDYNDYQQKYELQCASSEANKYERRKEKYESSKKTCQKLGIDNSSDPLCLDKIASAAQEFGLENKTISELTDEDYKILRSTS